MKEFTEEQIAKYVKGDGVCCPECGSENLDALGHIISEDESTLSQEVSCLACGAQWDDCYTLTGIGRRRK